MPMIHVELFPGRSIEQKREWVEIVTRETCRIMKVPPEAVDVVFVEFEKHNRACAGKLWIDREEPMVPREPANTHRTGAGNS